MLLEIDDYKTIADLQDRFSECFPYLKIEFYEKPHHWQEETATALQLRSEMRIGAIRKKHDPGILNIVSEDKTGTIEKTFRKQFGLHVQIFRRHKNSWVQTSASDALTLSEQMELAIASTKEG